MKEVKIAHGDKALQDILQFADITRSVVHEQFGNIPALIVGIEVPVLSLI